jgi:hypothetical protein
MLILHFPRGRVRLDCFGKEECGAVVRCFNRRGNTVSGKQSFPSIVVTGARLLILAAIALVCAGKLPAQYSVPFAALPDAPIPKQDQNPNPPKVDIKTTMHILSERSVFFPELAFDKGRLSSAKKLELAVDETIAPSRFLGSAFTAAIGQARDSLPGYGQGWGGYGKRFGSSVASNASSHVFGTFLLPSMLHQDPRYFVLLFGSLGARILYAIERQVITRTDDGRSVFNTSGILGGLMAEGLANSYLPDGERTAGKTFERYGYRVGFGALDNVVKEFWPTIFKSLRINNVIPARGADPGTVTPPTGPPPPPTGSPN